MVYDFQTHETSSQLTLCDTHTYVWDQSLESARFLCSEISAGDGHGELFQWIDSLEAGQRLNALRACLLVFAVTNGQVLPRQFQLRAGLAAYEGKNTVVNAGTGSGKTLSMAIPLLMNLDAVAIIVSPLKRLQSTQAKELERFLMKPLVVNQDVELSPAEIKVFCAISRSHHLT